MFFYLQTNFSNLILFDDLVFEIMWYVFQH